MKCIYCDKPLRDDPSRAHVIPQALGGRLKATGTCCGRCNNEVSRLETKAIQELWPVIGGFEITREDGERGPPVVFTVEGRGEFEFRDGIAAPRDEFRDRTPDGQPGAFIRTAKPELLVARGLTELQKMGASVADVERGATRLEFYDQGPAPKQTGPQPVDFATSSQRGMALKIALELLAFVAPDAARRPETLTVRRAVTAMSRGIRPGWLPCWMEMGPCSSGHVLGSLPSFAHVIEVWSTPEGWLGGRVVLFGHFTFGCVLADQHWRGGSVSTIYALDPVSGECVIPPSRRSASAAATSHGFALATRQNNQGMITRFEVQEARRNAARPAPALSPMPVRDEIVEAMKREEDRREQVRSERRARRGA